MARKTKQASDSVLARLTPGEFVVRKAAAKKLGSKAMRQINRGRAPKRACK